MALLSQTSRSSLPQCHLRLTSTSHPPTREGKIYVRHVSLQEMLAATGHGWRQGDQLHPPEFEIEVGRWVAKLKEWWESTPPSINIKPCLVVSFKCLCWMPCIRNPSPPQSHFSSTPPSSLPWPWWTKTRNSLALSF